MRGAKSLIFWALESLTPDTVARLACQRANLTRQGGAAESAAAGAAKESSGYAIYTASSTGSASGGGTMRGSSTSTRSPRSLTIRAGVPTTVESAGTS